MARTTLAFLLALSAPMMAQAEAPTKTEAPAKAEAPAQAEHDYSEMAKNLIAKFDTNKDSKVSMEEFTKPGQEQFKGIDQNSDGSLTEDEAKAAIEKEIAARTEQMEQMRQMQQQMQQQQPPSKPEPAKTK
jgi:hypothetical protein